MATKFNKLHQLVLEPLFRRITLVGTPITRLQELATKHTMVYITPWIGQLEYQFLNSLFIHHNLPLAHYANGLHTPNWRPLREMIRQQRLLRSRTLVSEPRGRRIARLIKANCSVLLRIKTTSFYDDRFWDYQQDDPLLGLLHGAEHTSEKRIMLIPMQIIWDNRPPKLSPTLVDLLFGDRLSPGKLRKMVLLLRNFDGRVQLSIGNPILLNSACPENAPVEGNAYKLRNLLLGRFQRERHGTTGPPIKPRSWMIEQTLTNDQVQRTIYDLARTQSSDVNNLQHLARSYAHEIAADINYRVLELVYRLMRWVFSTMYEGVQLEMNELEKVRKVMQQGPIILIPNHRSHMDYLLLSTLLYQHKLAIPYVAGGMNMNFWPFGWIARRCGAFFLRRSFQGNRLYRTVFAAYLQLLIHDGHCTEFFIEGGRSRSGKLLEPRYGMLSMIHDMMQGESAQDLHFVPISITYDRVVEQGF